MASKNYTILCCDGGGIRGLLTAMLLNGLPTNLVPNTQLFAGTSTGGILSIGMAAGIALSDLVNLYSTDCPSIFTQTPAASPAEINTYILNLVGQSAFEAAGIQTLIQQGYVPITAFSAKWSNASLKTQLQQILGNQATTTFQNLKTKLMVTTFQLDTNGTGQWTPITIDNVVSNSSSTLLDAAMCTSAAPTYFPPYNHPTLGYCVDGGMYANNPSTVALVRALQAGVDPASIYILSIGTGATANGIPASYFDSVAPELWGMLQWMMPFQPPSAVPSETLVSMLMDGSSEIDDQQTAALLPKGHYLRVEVPLPSPVPLDDCTQVSALQGLATNFMTTQTWQSAVSWVKQNWV